jgi:7-cyano-7-deazaguanine synthase
MKSVVVFSGGLDSTVLVSMLHNARHNLLLVTFDYGQRHRREIDAAKQVAAYFGAEHLIVSLPFGQFLNQNALTGDTQIPHGAYDETTMADTVVPNRNTIMLSVAASIAVDREADVVATAVHGGDHYLYSDCRPEFLATLQQTWDLALENASPMLHTPFVGSTKGDIARLGISLGAPLHLTWSCYEGGDIPCGECGTCREREQAFIEAGVDDPAYQKTSA